MMFSDIPTTGVFFRTEKVAFREGKTSSVGTMSEVWGSKTTSSGTAATDSLHCKLPKNVLWMNVNGKGTPAGAPFHAFNAKSNLLILLFSSRIRGRTSR